MSYLDYITNDFARGWVANRSEMRKKVSVPLVYIDINDGNMHDAIMFSQIMYWHEPSRETGQPRLKKQIDGHLWLAKNHGDWYEECRIKPRTARQCLVRLKERGLIHYELHGFAGNATPHIRVNWEVFAQKVQEVLNPDMKRQAPDISCQPLCHDMSDPLTSDVKSNTKTTTENTTESIDSTSRGHASAQSAIDVPTPSDDLNRPRKRYVPQETNGEEEVKSELQLYIEQCLGVQLTKKHVALLENEPYTINEETREKKKEPSAIQRYIDDERYGKYVAEQMDFYVSLCDEQDKNRKDVRRRACHSISNMHLERYGFFKWLARSGQPIDPDDNKPGTIDLADWGYEE